VSATPLEKINIAEILFFKHLVKCRYLGMVLLYIYRRGMAYKQEINQDLKISDRSVDEAIGSLLDDKMIKGIKSQNGRISEYYSVTPVGAQVARTVETVIRTMREQVSDST
jgi:DNA-binding MarR family transcriptional regulator